MVITGLDEVGRGCWAGPLVAAAVALSDHQDGPSGLRDSKKLSRQQRQRLDIDIRSQAKAYGVGWVTPDEVDSFGLTTAVSVAMHRAMADLHSNFSLCKYEEIIIDGNYNFLTHLPGTKLDLTHVTETAEIDVKGLTSHIYKGAVRTMVGADARVAAVSAASILAKVARDSYMLELAQIYPAYGFERHVGYGTAAHLCALQQHGATPVHRQSFKPIAALLSRA